MEFNRGHSDFEELGDFSIGKPPAHQFENLILSRSGGLSSVGVFSECPRGLAQEFLQCLIRNPEMVCGHAMNRPPQRVRNCTVRNVPIRAHDQQPHNLVFRFFIIQHNEFRVQGVFPQLLKARAQRHFQSTLIDNKDSIFSLPWGKIHVLLDAQDLRDILSPQ